MDPDRQTTRIAHSIIVDPSNRFALVADLGLDKVFVYRFNEKNGSLTPNDPPFATVKPGSGPRHIKFDSNGKWVYVINEMGCAVTGFNWDARKAPQANSRPFPLCPRDSRARTPAPSW